MVRFIVISLTSALPQHKSCSIIEEHQVFPAIYSKVYGPASQNECLQWRSVHCGKETEDHIVIALTGTSYEGCRVLPADSFYPAIFSHVFGPADKQQCSEWLVANCGNPTAQF